MLLIVCGRIVIAASIMRFMAYAKAGQQALVTVQEAVADALSRDGIAILPPGDVHDTLKLAKLLRAPFSTAVLDPWYNKGVGGVRDDYVSYVLGILDEAKEASQHIYLWGFPEIIAPFVERIPQPLRFVAWLTWYFKNNPSVIRGWRSAQMTCLHLSHPGAGLYIEHFLNEAQLQSHLVLDPMSGSGTTAEAARNMGRCAVICDHSEEYTQIAEKRLNVRRLDIAGEIKAALAAEPTAAPAPWPGVQPTARYTVRPCSTDPAMPNQMAFFEKYDSGGNDQSFRGGAVVSVTKSELVGEPGQIELALGVAGAKGEQEEIEVVLGFMKCVGGANEAELEGPGQRGDEGDALVALQAAGGAPDGVEGGAGAIGGGERELPEDCGAGMPLEHGFAPDRRRGFLAGKGRRGGDAERQQGMVIAADERDQLLA